MPIDSELVTAALEVRRRAYAKYSQFLVGAALRGVDGRLFVGCNVENASYGLTICAERAAVFAAVAAGCRQFSQLALAATNDCTPCGACRQVLVEFAPDMEIVLVDADNPAHLRVTSLRELLPSAFQSVRNSPNH